MFKLREFRKSHSLFQSQLAEILDVAQSGISRMETEQLDLTPSQYEKLCETYGKDDVDSFLISNEDIPRRYFEDIDPSEIIGIIKKQNDIICEYAKNQQIYTEKIMNMVERLVYCLSDKSLPKT